MNITIHELGYKYAGIRYRTADNWFSIIPVNKKKPINYLEIGAFHGLNTCSVGVSYAAHPDSRMYVIDPWEKYNEYPEYNNTELNTAYDNFMFNININNLSDKTIVHRGYSNIEIPKLEDNSFDIIYIDGNHEPEFVLEDAVLAFRKLKVGGYMIFDDYGWCGPDLTQRGIDAFISGYHKRIKHLNNKRPLNTQMFIQKLS